MKKDKERQLPHETVANDFEEVTKEMVVEDNE